MRIIWRKDSVVIIGIILMLLVFSSGSTNAQTTPSKTVKIGCSLPINISFGLEIQKALEVCVDIINREGGVTVGGERYGLEMIVYDHKYRAEPALAATQRLINVDKVKAIVNDTGAAGILASIPVVERAGLPYFYQSHSEKIFGFKYKYQYETTTGRSIEAVYNLLLKARPDIKTVVFAGQDDEIGHDLIRKAKIIFGAQGVKVLEDFYFPRDMRDYTPVATKVVSIKPDLFAIPGFGGAAEKMGLMSKALSDANWRGVTYVTASPVIKDLVQICPKGEAEGLYMPMSDFTVLQNPPPLAIKVRKGYEQKYGEWKETGPYWTVPLWFYVAAVKKAGSFEAAEIDKVMPGLEVDTPVGKAKLMKRPDLNITRYWDSMVSPALIQLRGSKVVPISSLSVKEAIGELEKAYGFKGQWE